LSNRPTIGNSLTDSARPLYGLEQMRAEFEGNRLEVILVPCRTYSNIGGCIRVAASKNARWYRSFCAAHGSSRLRRNNAPDTRIKRANIAALLDRLCAGLPSRSKYAPEIIRIAERLERAAA
jgi:hypothetical protein